MYNLNWANKKQFEEKPIPLFEKLKHIVIMPFILFLINVVMLNAAFICAFWIKYGSKFTELHNFDSYKDSSIFLTFMYMLAFAFVRFFKSRFVSLWDLFRSIFSGLLLGTLFGVAFIYVFRVRWGSFPSTIFVISFPISLFFIYLADSFFLRLAGGIKKKVIVIGKQASKEVLNGQTFVERTFVDTIEDILKHEDVDEIVICERIHEDRQLNLLVHLLLKLKVNVVFSPSIYAELLSQNMMNENSVQFLTTFVGRKSDTEEFLIRALDIFVSVLVLTLLGPLLVFVWVLIKLTSPGSAFYKQIRVSKDGDTFTMYKFKTMVNDAEKQTGPVLAEENDPRVTRIGRLLRDTRIDEIPQLINVIRGKMSLVGPRPERPHFVKRHKALRETRLAVKPGLTGLAQIRSFYDLKPQHKIKYDYLYIQRRSLLLNLYILSKTIPVVFLKKGR